MVTNDQLAGKIENALAQERSRIARDLHDGVAQQLALALLQLEYLQRLLENEDNRCQSVLTQIHKISTIIQASLLELRHCISSSVPFPLAQGGFTSALPALLDSYRSEEGWHICYRYDELARVPDRLEIPVYRFLQEALTNIRKHARASRVTIRFRISSDSLIITVSDDGCGFPSTSTSSALFENDQHFGLHLMRAHIEHLGGCWQIWSQPGQGTTLQVCFPLPGE